MEAASATVEEYLKERNIPYRRSQSEVYFNCPRCQDTKGHLYMNAETWLFQCKKCDWKGNRITWLQERGELELATAAPLNTDLQLLMQRAIEFLHWQLPTRISNYLFSRGLTSQTIQTQLIGYGTNLEGLRRHLKELNFDPETIKKSGILQRMQNRWFLQSRIVIPYWNKGRITWFRGRLDPDSSAEGSPKYLSPRSWSIQPYNLDCLATASDRLFICEGEPDTWALHAMGYPALGIPGAGTFKADWLPLLSPFPKIYLCLDPDLAGQKGAARIASLLGDRARMVQLPEGLDLNDFFCSKNHTREDFEALLQQSKPVEKPPTEEAPTLELELPNAPVGRSLIVPKGWSLHSDGLFQHSISRNGEPIKALIASAPIYISERTINLDTHEEKLALAHVRDDAWKSHHVDRSIVMDHRKLVGQATYGLPVNSLNARDIVQFLQAFESANQYKIPRKHAITGFGWKTYNGKRFFVLGSHTIGADDLDIVRDAESFGEERMARAISKQGSLDEWLRGMRLLPIFPRVLFGLYASFVPPLLQLFDLPNFIIDYAGASSQGKTTVLMIAASVWGLPIREQGGLIVGLRRLEPRDTMKRAQNQIRSEVARDFGSATTGWVGRVVTRPGRRASKDRAAERKGR
jgi:hypothetical protein